MRDSRTNEENWAIDVLLGHLNKNGEEWIEDAEFSDSPDLVIDGVNGARIACEVSGVGINEWHQWKNDPTKKLGLDELDAMYVPREADLWLRNVVKSKRDKVPTYLTRSGASEAWLLIHGGLIKAYDFFFLDESEAYDLPLMQQEAVETAHPFSRIYVVSSAGPISIASIYPPDPNRPPAPDLSKPETMKILELRLITKDISGGGVVPIAIGNGFKPHREVLLEPLGASRRRK